MEPWTIVAVVAAGTAFVLWEMWTDRSSDSRGRPPYPPIRITDNGSIRVIDLRGVPFPNNSHLVLDFALEALATRPPCGLRVWVLPEKVVAAWLQMGPLVWVIFGARMKDGRKQPGDDAIWVPGISAEQERMIDSGGVMPISELTAFTTTGKKIPMKTRLGRPPKRPSGPERPVLPATLYSSLLWTYVIATDDAVYVDLRRASVAAIEKGGALAYAREQLEKTAERPRRIWLLSAWILDIWARREQAIRGELETLMGIQPPTESEHLVMDGPGGDAAMLELLGSLGLGPLVRDLQLHTNKQSFVVSFPEVLEDLMLFQAYEKATKPRPKDS